MSSRAVSTSKNNAPLRPLSAVAKKMRATREARRLDVLHKVYTRSGDMSYVMLRRLMALIDAGCPKVEKAADETDGADTPEPEPAPKTPVKSALKPAKAPNAPKKQQQKKGSVERVLAFELEPVVASVPAPCGKKTKRAARV